MGRLHDKTDSLNTFEDWLKSYLSNEEYAEWYNK